jgi:cellulose synthase/poly-beta-1,6-N-acetylglucosamine synthase-like glycosyltransferase
VQDLVSLIVVVTSLVLGAVAALTLSWMLYAWRSPDGHQATRFSRGEPGAVRRLRFSILVPARHEDQVLAGTLDGLAALDHPHVEVLCIVGHDDPDTAAVARAAAERHPGVVRVVVDHSWPKNKPKALNTALPECTGDVVGVFDAEDEVAPGLLRAIETTFHTDRADVVQGGVQLMNVRSSWWSLRNCMEYFFWFRSRLHFHADRDFIPLGGNTVFVRTELLRAVDGWDAECLAEDCELGVRLSSLGAWVSVAYEPALATREETPGSIASLVKQRTRWNQGFLQVLRKGEWRGLPTARQRLLARYTLLTPLIQAVTGLIVPVSLLLILFAHTPAVITLIGFVPLMLVIASVSVEVVALHEFGREYGVRIGPRQYLGLVLGTMPYQWLLAFAAVRAVVRERRGETGWEKTAHVGAHRDPAPVTAPVEESRRVLG